MAESWWVMLVYVKDSAGVRTVELPDPREAFCREVNRLASATGIVASISPFPSQPSAQVRRHAGHKSGPRKAKRGR